MGETGEGQKPQEVGTDTKSGVVEYLKSTTNYQAEQAHIDRSTSPLRGLLQKLNNARLTNAGIIDRLRGSKK